MAPCSPPGHPNAAAAAACDRRANAVDILAQAKSGTGKTVVFAVLALELLRPDVAAPQVLMLAPTRELAQQSHAVVQALAARLPAVRAALIVGGVGNARSDGASAREAHILVGTPGTRPAGRGPLRRACVPACQPRCPAYPRPSRHHDGQAAFITC